MKFVSFFELVWNISAILGKTKQNWQPWWHLPVVKCCHSLQHLKLFFAMMGHVFTMEVRLVSDESFSSPFFSLSRPQNLHQQVIFLSILVIIFIYFYLFLLLMLYWNLFFSIYSLRILFNLIFISNFDSHYVIAIFYFFFLIYFNFQFSQSLFSFI
jgi:hypothetical protein